MGAYRLIILGHNHLCLTDINLTLYPYYAKQKFFWQEILPISSKTKLGISELEKILKNCLN